jgi:hypothetical protein
MQTSRPQVQARILKHSIRPISPLVNRQISPKPQRQAKHSVQCPNHSGTRLHLHSSITALSLAKLFT